MASVLDIVALGNGGNHRRAPIDLADATENDFGAAVIFLHRSVDLDRLSNQPSHVANVLQIVLEDNDREWTRQLIFTEIEKVNALFSDSYANDFASYAFGFSDVLTGIMNRKAVGGLNNRNEQERGGEKH